MRAASSRATPPDQRPRLRGLRPGEALALQWRDIREQTILVERAISLGEEKDTKTAAHRTVRLLQPLAVDLREWRLRSGRPREKRWCSVGRRNGVDASGVQSWRRRAFRRAIEAAGRSTPGRTTSAIRSRRCCSTRAIGDLCRPPVRSRRTANAQQLRPRDRRVRGRARLDAQTAIADARAAALPAAASSR